MQLMRDVYLGQTYVSQNHNMKVANKSCVDSENFKYLGPTLTNQNSMHEGIRSRLIREILAPIWLRIPILPMYDLKT
jgi:hypothetical protein